MRPGLGFLQGIDYTDSGNNKLMGRRAVPEVVPEGNEIIGGVVSLCAFSTSGPVPFLGVRTAVPLLASEGAAEESFCFKHLGGIRGLSANLESPQTEDLRVGTSGRFPVDLGIRPLGIKNLLESNPLKSRFLAHGWAAIHVWLVSSPSRKCI